MIKSIFDDEEPDAKDSKSGKPSPAEPTFNPPMKTAAEKEARTEKPEERSEAAEPASEGPGKEVTDKGRDAALGAEAVSESDLKKRLADIKAELETLQKMTPGGEKGSAEAGEPDTEKEPEKAVQTAADTETGHPDARKKPEEAGVPVSQSLTSGPEQVADSAEPVPESAAETLRRSGMAYSAAIALFGSVIFMLILGWFADLLLGIKPWGTVIGITLGSIIGFFQFFRITSQIFKPKASEFEQVSLLSAEPDSGEQAEAKEFPQPGGSENPNRNNGTEEDPEGRVPVDDFPASEGKRDNP